MSKAVARHIITETSSATDIAPLAPNDPLLTPVPRASRQDMIGEVQELARCNGMVWLRATLSRHGARCIPKLSVRALREIIVATN